MSPAPTPTHFVVFETARSEMFESSVDDARRAYYVLVRFDSDAGDFVATGDTGFDDGYNECVTDVKAGETLQTIRGTILASYGGIVKIEITKL